MSKFTIKIDKSAIQDIQEAFDWYEFKSRGTGTKFKKTLISQINTLKISPLNYAIRYAEVRCMVIKGFPFLVHFTVDESISIVKVFAILHTSRNPKIWNERLANSN